MGACCAKEEGEKLIVESNVEDDPIKAEDPAGEISPSQPIIPSTTSSEDSAVNGVNPLTRDRSSVDIDANAPSSARPSSWRISWGKNKNESLSSTSTNNSTDKPQPANNESLKSKRMSRVTHHPLAHEHVRDVVTHVLGQKKDQDRAVCVPALLPGVLYCGVFDGHGRDGEIRSELATTELPRLIKQELEKVVDEGRPIKEKDLHNALDTSYAEFHSQLDQMYEETVYKHALEAAAAARLQSSLQNENSELDDSPVRMPQDGGTTATSVIVSGDLIVVGWVGDSRAVLARRIAKKRGPILNRFSSRLKISTLTEDHNVAANNDEEMARVAEQGGEIYGKHLANGAVEGMLQLTRSLGDSPFHRTGLVVAKPGIVTIPVSDDNSDPLLFLLVASDGLWDYFSNKEALSFVYKRLKKDSYANETSVTKRNQILTETARALEAEAIKRSVDRNSHSDDITILLLTFSKGWSIEADDTPSF